MKRSRPSFADVVAEVKAQAAPARGVVVRPGEHTPGGELLDPEGNLVTCVGEISRGQARTLVRSGALLAWEGCGCGGWTGCQPTWFDAEVRSALRERSTPRFKTKRHGAPTWIDLWQGDGGSVVYAHGDVVWGDAFA